MEIILGIFVFMLVLCFALEAIKVVLELTVLLISLPFILLGKVYDAIRKRVLRYRSS